MFNEISYPCGLMRICVCPFWEVITTITLEPPFVQVWVMTGDLSTSIQVRVPLRGHDCAWILEMDLAGSVLPSPSKYEAGHIRE